MRGFLNGIQLVIYLLFSILVGSGDLFAMIGESIYHQEVVRIIDGYC